MMAKVADVVNMSPKRGNNQFYKGKGGTSQGRSTTTGKYLMDTTKMKFIVAPDLTQCPLKPYVSKRTPKLSKEVEKTA
jgi:hypothetical protein